MKIKNIKSIPQYLLGLLFMMAYSSMSFAQTFSIGSSGIPNDLFTPTAGDKSVQILTALFGGLPIFGGTGTDAFMAPIGIFNQLVLIVGGVLTAYTILAGTMMTAHDGEVLGKQFHSIWVPMRTAIGSALVLPLFSGYCIAQVAVAWLLVQGIGLADQVWEKFTSNSNLTNVVSVGFNDPTVYKLAQDILKAEVCMSALSAEATSNPSVYSGANFSVSNKTTPSYSVVTNPETGATNFIPGKTVYSFGNATSTANIAPDVCGSVTVTQYTGNGSATDTTGNIAAINAAQASALQAMISTSQTIANSIVTQVVNNTKAPGTYDATSTQQQINAMIGTYNNTVRQAAANAYNSAQPYQDIANNATQDGWFLAGAWFMKLAAMQENAQQAVSAVPTSTSITEADGNDTVKDAIAKYMPTLTQATKNTLAASDFGINKQTQQDMERSSSFAEQFFSKMTVFKMAPTENPIMAMKRMGDWIFDIIAIMIGIITGGSIAGIAVGLFTGGAAATGILTLVVTIMPVLTMMFILGVTLSFVLPMLPMFIWLGAAIGWLILAVEGIIAAPLWVVMHLNPKGSDLVGTAGKGYMMVLSLMLRPVLMVFGLVAAIIMTNVVGQFINTIYTSLFIMSQQGSNWVVWLVGSCVAGPILYAGMMYVFIKKMFSIIHIIPDQLLGWIGGGGPSLGEYSRQMSASGAVALNQGVQQLSSLGSGVANQLNQQVQKGQAKNAAKQANEDMMEQATDNLGLDSSGASNFQHAISGMVENAGSGQSGTQRLQAQGGAIKSASEKIGRMADMFGGHNSPDFQNMMKAFHANTADSPPTNNTEFNEALTNAVTQTLSEKYGSAAGQAMVDMNKTDNGGFNVGGLANSINAASQIESNAIKSGGNIGSVRQEIGSAITGASGQFHAGGLSGNTNPGKFLTDSISSSPAAMKYGMISSSQSDAQQRAMAQDLKLAPQTENISATPAAVNGASDSASAVTATPNVSAEGQKDEL